MNRIIDRELIEAMNTNERTGGHNRESSLYFPRTLNRNGATKKSWSRTLQRAEMISRPPWVAQETFEQALAIIVENHTVTPSMLSIQLGKSNSVAQRILSHLVSKGVIDKIGHGIYKVRDEKGLENA